VLGTAALMMIPLTLAFEQPFKLSPTMGAMASLLTLALLGTAFAYILYYWLIHNIGATRTSLVTYIMPFIGVVWGALILNERLDSSDIIGLVLIVVGILVVARPSVQATPTSAVIVEGE
jgi:drug/metabolite transporter (DMT)-like permease